MACGMTSLEALLSLACCPCVCPVVFGRELRKCLCPDYAQTRVTHVNTSEGCCCLLGCCFANCQCLRCDCGDKGWRTGRPRRATKTKYLTLSSSKRLWEEVDRSLPEYARESDMSRERGRERSSSMGQGFVCFFAFPFLFHEREKKPSSSSSSTPSGHHHNLPLLHRSPSN